MPQTTTVVQNGIAAEGSERTSVTRQLSTTGRRRVARDATLDYEQLQGKHHLVGHQGHQRGEGRMGLERNVHEYEERPDRPDGVSCLSCLTVIGGVIALIIGLVVLAVPADQIKPGAEGLRSFGALLIFGGAGLSFAVAWGLWSLRTWAWYLTLTLEVLGICLSAIQLLSGSNTLAAMLVAGIVIYYLYRPHVRAAFGLD